MNTALAPMTVPLEEAARLLETTPEALVDWSNQGDVALVLTPAGERELPASHLADLRAAMERDGLTLAEVNSKRRHLAEEIDVDALLPELYPADRHGHRPPELRALVYHRLVAERLDETVRATARERLERWAESGRVHPEWARRWREALALPLEELAAMISADRAETRALHQTSPFAGALNEQERRRLLAGVELALNRL